MRRRVLDALAGREGIDPDELTVQTYHAFAASIVREHAPLLGLDGDAALLDRARQWQLALEALDRCAFDRARDRLAADLRRQGARRCTRRCCATSSRPTQVRDWCAAQPARRGRARSRRGRAGGRVLPRAQARAQRARLRRPDRARGRAAATRGPRCSSGCAPASASSSSTSTRTPTSPSASSCKLVGARRASSSAPSATSTRGSSAGAARRSTTCSPSADDFPGARFETLSIELPLRQARSSTSRTR